MNNFVTSLIRTYVPIVIGAFVSYLVALGIDLDANTQAGLIVAMTGFLQATYYLVVRLLEKQFPEVGILLGSTAKPVYLDTIK